MTLAGKTILITGAARRIGRSLALTAAQAGANIILHHSNSPEDASRTAAEIEKLGCKAWILQSDFSHPEAAEGLIAQASALSPIDALVNNAAIFEPLTLAQTQPGRLAAPFEYQPDCTVFTQPGLCRQPAVRQPRPDRQHRRLARPAAGRRSLRLYHQ